jgi:hypothetical protein
MIAASAMAKTLNNMICTERDILKAFIVPPLGWENK